MVLKDSGWDRKKLALEYGLKERNKKRLRQAGPSSAQAGIRLYFNFLQIWFLPIWIDKIGLIK